MRFPTALKRLLLCVVLVLNGPGTAAAATQMHAAGAAAAGTMVATTAGEGGAPTDAQANCHRSHGPVAGPAAAGHTGAQSAAKASQPAGDHCTVGGCQCTCLQQAPLLAAGTRIPGPAALPRPSLHPLLAGHPAPALAHPLRPPIG